MAVNLPLTSDERSVIFSALRNMEEGLHHLEIKLIGPRLEKIEAEISNIKKRLLMLEELEVENEKRD